MALPRPVAPAPPAWPGGAGPSGGRGQGRAGAPDPPAVRTLPTADGNLALERQIAQLRWIGIAFGALSGPFLGLGGRVIGVYAVVVAASIYNLVLGHLIATGQAARLRRAYAHGFFEILLATAIVAVTGGAASPFYLAYFWVVVHAAIRLGRRTALLSSALSALCYTLVIALVDGPAALDSATIVLRLGFLTITAVFAGFLADRARGAESALAHQLDQARALNRASAALTGSLEWAVVVQQIAEQGRVLAGADAAILEFRRALPGLGGSAAGVAGARVTDVLPSGAFLTKLVLQGGLLAALPAPGASVVILHDLAAADAVVGDHAGRLPRGGLLRAPLLIQGGWVADLLLLRAMPGRAFTLADADIIRAFTNQVALTLENASLYGRAREQAATDPITGLPNHRALKERLDEELARAGRQGRPLCVLMLDLDHFKAFNDAFGHAAGDAALRAVAGELRGPLRRGAYAARYGGEEFVAVLPDTDLQAGSALAERLRATIAALVERPAGERGREHLPGPLTASIGVAAFPDHGADREQLLQAADLAMYLAKHIGRNQVCLATDLGTARGLDALFAQLSSHLTHPTARWGPHLVSELEQRFTRLAALRVDPDERELGGEAEAIYDYTIQTVTALAATIDAKDHYTEGHSRHVAALSVALARATGGCTRAQIETIRVGGLLHDIGKIGIPEAILNKPSGLTAEEWTIMRAHPDTGARILAPIAALRAVIPLVRHHHEHWDGRGYPLRMRGEAIPLGARIIAICDAYDTMISNRPYRRGLRHEDAIARLLAGAGTQFDPDLVRLFADLPPSATRLPLAAEGWPPGPSTRARRP